MRADRRGRSCKCRTWPSSSYFFGSNIFCVKNLYEKFKQRVARKLREIYRRDDDDNTERHTCFFTLLFLSVCYSFVFPFVHPQRRFNSGSFQVLFTNQGNIR